jgi:solute carrier family 25 (mitochondrial carnitine/acylcarnitine transporter), member 20/29
MKTDQEAKIDASSSSASTSHSGANKKRSSGLRAMLPDVSSILAGFVSGACGSFVGHPLDTLKVRVQLGMTSMVPSTAAGSQSLSSATALSSIRASCNVAQIRSLYRGLLPPLLTSGVLNSLNFAIYEENRSWLSRDFNLDRNSPANVYIASAIAGSTISLVTAPISLVKIQRQKFVAASEDSRSYARMIKDIWEARGLRGMYRAYLPVLCMESMGRGFYMYTYFTCKPWLAELIYGDRTRAETFVPRASSAAIAGCLSWMAVYPIDVVKAKLQADAAAEVYSGVLDCTRKVYAQEGLRAFSRGIGYTLIRAAPTAATVLPIYEMTKDKLTEMGI